jgi:hypothetical protein
MKQIIDGIAVSPNQQADAIDRAIHFYINKKPRSHSEATVKYHLAALKAAAKTIREEKP